jgi:tRNA-dihydrouridine synthase A
VGGSEPEKLESTAKYVRKAGYSEVNINIGCPSSKVQSGCFGVVLMKQEHRANLADSVDRMWKGWESEELKGEDSKPKHTEFDEGVTVKCRIGVDDEEGFEFSKSFVEDLGATKGENSKYPDKRGATHFIMHARKAYLKGLNPAENRNVPPLDYDTVLKLAKEFPQYDFTINGGFKTYEQIEDILKPENGLKGVMVGRLAMNNPWYLNDVDRRIYGQRNPGYTRREMLQIWGQYVDKIEE